MHSALEQAPVLARGALSIRVGIQGEAWTCGGRSDGAAGAYGTGPWSTP